MLGGGRASDRGRVMDGWRQRRVILFGWAARFKSCPRNHEDPTNTAILPDGGFCVSQSFVVSQADGVRQEV